MDYPEVLQRPARPAERRVSHASQLCISIALLPHQFDAAEELVGRRYAWRGYRVAQETVREGYTLLAEYGGRLWATLTARPEGRLHAEASYGPEIGFLRAQGRRVGEITRLAVESGVDSKAAFHALVKAAWRITHVVHALTDVVIEVNPRHMRFYERAFGFEVAASGGVCSRVGAPSVLMRVVLEELGERLRFSAA